MERTKAMVASAIIAVTLTTGAVAFAASSGVIGGRHDNVGNLQLTTPQPTDLTVFVDPATDAVTATTQETATTAGTASTRSDDNVSGSDDSRSDDSRNDDGGHSGGQDDD